MTSPLSSVPISPDANASEQSRKALQDQLNGLGGLSGRKLSPEAKAKKLREACEGFESIFIQKMWQEMRNTVPKGGMLQGKEERFWQDMYDQELSKSMTSAGGIGLADMMYDQLSRNLVSASRTTAGQVMGGAFTPAAAPLVNQPLEEESQLVAEADMPRQPGAVPSIYDGEAPEAAGMTEAASTQQAQAVMVASVQTAQTETPTQPVNMVYQQPVVQATAEQPKAQNRPRVKKTTHGKDTGNGQNAINLAYLAKREAGDKLGSGAIRPPLRARKQHEEKAAPVQEQPQAASTFQQNGNLTPGSGAGLKAALELARSGAVAPETGNDMRLGNLVANVRAQNAARAAADAASSQQRAAVADAGNVAAEPVKRIVRYTTNIPPRTKSKKGEQAIRLLNTDNVGVNSKAGKGLAAYHAAQEAAQAAAAPAQAVAESQQPQAAPAAPIMPLTAQSAGKTDEGQTRQNFNIPPLTAGDLRG